MPIQATVDRLGKSQRREAPGASLETQWGGVCRAGAGEDGRALVDWGEGRKYKGGGALGTEWGLGRGVAEERCQFWVGSVGNNGRDCEEVGQ